MLAPPSLPTRSLRGRSRSANNVSKRAQRIIECWQSVQQQSEYLLDIFVLALGVPERRDVRIS